MPRTKDHRVWSVCISIRYYLLVITIIIYLIITWRTVGNNNSIRQNYECFKTPSVDGYLKAVKTGPNLHTGWLWNISRTLAEGTLLGTDFMVGKKIAAYCSHSLLYGPPGVSLTLQKKQPILLSATASL